MTWKEAERERLVFLKYKLIHIYIYQLKIDKGILVTVFNHYLHVATLL